MEAILTGDKIEFIINKFKNLSHSEIGKHVGLTAGQVNRVIIETKKNLRESVLESSAEDKIKVEEFIKDNLTKTVGPSWEKENRDLEFLIKIFKTQLKIYLNK